MSKWVDDSSFRKFKENKKKEEENKGVSGEGRLNVVWRTPEKGTIDKAKVYEGRFLQDPEGNFYLKYFYHMFKMGDKWFYMLCPKTYDMDNYCAWCSVVSKLYSSGNKKDSAIAYNYKRKVRFCGDWYVVNDPRDAEVENVDDKASKKVWVYEFPSQVEEKVKTEMMDEKEGAGPAIFDPEEGYNMILRVKSTKIDPKTQKQYPDYSGSSFSRKPSALGTEEEIAEIMKQRYSLEKHIKKMEVSEERIIQSIKAEMMWDLIEDEYERMTGNFSNKEDTPDDTDEPSFDVDEDAKGGSGSVDTPEESSKDDDLSEEDIMKELENM